MIAVFIIVGILFLAITSLREKMFSGGGEKVITYYYTDWCGFCQAFKPRWELLKKEYGHLYKFAEVNGDEARPNFVQSFPTIMMTLPNKRRLLKYSGTRDYDDLVKWIKSPHQNM